MKKSTRLGLALLLGGLSGGANALIFDLTFTPGTSDQERASFIAAGQMWSDLLVDDVTVKLTVGTSAGLASGALAAASSSYLTYGYRDVRDALVSDARSALDQTAVRHLGAANRFGMLINYTLENPGGYGSATPYVDDNNSLNNSVINMTAANARALGLSVASVGVVSGCFGQCDAFIQFNSNFAWDHERNDGIASNTYDFIGAAAHEIGHALGFVSGVDTLVPYSGPTNIYSENFFPVVSTLDLFRYSDLSAASGVIDWTADKRDKYFSVDGGATKGPLFSTGQRPSRGDGAQASHWKDDSFTGAMLGIMDPVFVTGGLVSISGNDLAAMDAIGWNLAAPVPEPGAWAMALVGGGVVGVMKRRRKTSTSLRAQRHELGRHLGRVAQVKAMHVLTKSAGRWPAWASALLFSFAALGLSACGGGGGGNPAETPGAQTSGNGGGNGNGGASEDDADLVAAAPVFSSGGLLWRTDGTEAGTVPVSDVEVSTAGYGNILFNGNTYFTTVTETGTELWKTDGTQAGTGMLQSFSFLCSPLWPLNGALYFMAYDDQHGCELWKTDGTPAGTVLLKEINPGVASSGSDGFTPTRSNEATVFKGALYFMANDGHHGFELWKTDGTAAGTVLVKDMNPGSESTDLDVDEFKPLNGSLYFVANAGLGGYGLWRTDGTTVDGVAVFGAQGEGFLIPQGNFLMTYGGALYFLGASSDGRSGLWKTDGTAAGTVFVKGSFDSIDEDGYKVYNGALYFVAKDGIHGRELWKTDGTTAGTVLVKDINPGVDSAGFERPNNSDIDLSKSKVFNGALYFSARDESHGRELWRTDGTEAGTVLVKDILPGPDDGMIDGGDAVEFKLYSGALYFRASNDSQGIQLWKTDGTEAGTVVLADISRPLRDVIALIKDVPYFLGKSPGGRLGLWKSDGTAASPVLVKDIDSANGDMDGATFVLLKDGLYIQTTSEGDDIALWKTDGTTAGTVWVKTFN
jgi:ELWxxDGT repeat protein